MSNEAFTATAILLVAAHVAALVWAVLSRRGVRMLLGLTALVAATVLAYQATRLPFTLRPPADERALLLIGFELVALGSALWGFGGARVPLALSFAAFGLHFCGAVAMLAFALLYQPRMF